MWGTPYLCFKNGPLGVGDGYVLTLGCDDGGTTVHTIKLIEFKKLIVTFSVWSVFYTNVTLFHAVVIFFLK